MGLTFRAVELHCLKNLLKDLRASQCLLEEEPHWITTETPLCLPACTQLIAKSHRLHLLTNPGMHLPLSTSSTRTRVRDTIVLNSGAPQSQLAFASPLCLPFVHFPHGSPGDFLLFKMKIRLRPHCVLALTLQRFPIGLRIKAEWLNHLEGPLQSSPCLTGKPHLIPLSPVPWAAFVSPQDPCTCPFFYLGSFSLFSYMKHYSVLHTVHCFSAKVGNMSWHCPSPSTPSGTCFHRTGVVCNYPATSVASGFMLVSPSRLWAPWMWGPWPIFLTIDSPTPSTGPGHHMQEKKWMNEWTERK